METLINDKTYQDMQSLYIKSELQSTLSVKNTGFSDISLDACSNFHNNEDMLTILLKEISFLSVIYEDIYNEALHIVAQKTLMRVLLYH